MMRRLRTPWFLSSVAISVFFVFTTMVYIPLETFTINQNDFWFGINHVLLPWCILALCSLLLLILVAFFMPELGRKIIFGGLFGITLLAYVQCNFLNPEYGVLDGRDIQWDTYGNASLNAGLWITVILLIIVLCCAINTHKVIRFMAFLLTVMQFVSLISLMPTLLYSKEDDGQKVLGNQHLYDVAENHNIIYLLIDSLDIQYVEKMLPSEWMKEFDGFSFYTNCVGSYSKTDLSVPYLLTGLHYYNNIPVNEYYQQAFSNSAFLNNLKAEGYTINLYTENWNGITEVADNAISEIPSGDFKTGISLVGKLMKLAAFRMSPLYLKPQLVTLATDFNTAIPNEVNQYIINDIKWFSDLNQKKLSIGNQDKLFQFIHLFGTHEPHTLTANVTEAKSESDVDQVTATMNMLSTYFRYLKDINAYDNAMIIVSADHGHYMTNQPALLIKYPHTQGEIKLDTSPVCQADIQQTIMGVIGGMELAEGDDLRFLSEDIIRDRVFYSYKIYETTASGYMPNLWEMHYTEDNKLPTAWTGIYQAGQKISIKEFSSIFPYDIPVPASEIADKYSTKGFLSWGDGSNEWISDHAGGIFFQREDNSAHNVRISFRVASNWIYQAYTITISAGEQKLYQADVSNNAHDFSFVIPNDAFDQDGYVFLYVEFSPLESPYTALDSQDIRYNTFYLQDITITKEALSF